jgi:fumarylacetoacetate (FAA) hydrolase family protein
MRQGDRVDVTVEEIGTLINTIEREVSPPDNVRH